MQYREALQAIDTIRTLDYFKLEHKTQGSYAKIPCKCGGTVSIKIHGEKKNLWYCPSCKKAGHIIAFAMKLKELEYEEAKKFLLKLSPTRKPIDKEITFEYELKFTKELEEMGLTEEMCQRYIIGVPQGRTMLAGCLAFLVQNNGTKIAYYGVRLKTGKPVFHRSFNPELYLYCCSSVKPENLVIFTTDILECVKITVGGAQAVCNFGLPYLSNAQIELLNRLQLIEFATYTPEIAQQATGMLKEPFYRFR